MLSHRSLIRPRVFTAGHRQTDVGASFIDMMDMCVFTAGQVQGPNRDGDSRGRPVVICRAPLAALQVQGTLSPTLSDGLPIAYTLITLPPSLPLQISKYTPAEDYHQQYLAKGGRNGSAQSPAKVRNDEGAGGQRAATGPRKVHNDDDYVRGGGDVLNEVHHLTMTVRRAGDAMGRGVQSQCNISDTMRGGGERAVPLCRSKVVAKVAGSPPSCLPPACYRGAGLQARTGPPPS